MASLSAERSRNRLLDAATEVVAERGVAAATVGEICSRAGLARTSLYHHFGDRRRLLAALVERVGTLWLEEIQKEAYLEPDPFRRLDRVLAAWAYLLQEKPELLRFLVFIQLDQGSQEIRVALERVLGEMLGAIADGIEDVAGMPIADAELIAHTLLGLLVAAVVRQGIATEPLDVDSLFGEMRRLVWLSVAARMPAGIRDSGAPR